MFKIKYQSINTTSLKKTIPSIEDPELKINTKSELTYYMTFPDNYIPENQYPLIISIEGYGGFPSSEYQSKKLRPYLSNKYQAIVIGVHYHGIQRSGANKINIDMGLWELVFNLKPGEFKQKIVDCRQFDDVLDRLFELMVERKITRIPQMLALNSILPDKYASFGFLPAIEHLAVLHDVISNYNIKQSDISIMGTSYGGYIALLMGKFAPHTFNSIIDNSGFVATQFSEIHPSIGNSGCTYMRMIDGVRHEIPVSTLPFWDNNELSDRYFSDAHRMIRNVTLDSHMIPSKTKYFIFHSREDSISLFPHKELFCNRLSRYAEVDFTPVTSADIDGELFKNLNHGMNASLRKLYDISHKKYEKLNPDYSNETDFHLGSTHTFNCFSKKYEFNFDLVKGLSVKINPAGKTEMG